MQEQKPFLHKALARSLDNAGSWRSVHMPVAILLSIVDCSIGRSNGFEGHDDR